ncbi:MAG: hypothetical protein Q8N23_26385 [Archangium sp.]|nr:hypothetical protein [Archangium sp.]MDP3571569.1 hypothetical protein [Archangium sp.]
MKRGWWLAAAVLLPRLAVLFVNENLAGDAIARTWIAHRWLDAPHFLTSFDDGARQFGPLHLYLLAAAELIWPSLLHAGRVLSLLVGALTAWPLHSFTARRFGDSAATFAVLGFAFWGLHVQCSTTSASEALNLLLVMSAVAFFDAERRVAAVLMLNLACATRYDSWLLVPLLAAVELWRSRSFAKAVGFGAAASAFAIFWLIGNQVGQGDALYPIRFIDQFHRDWWPREARIWDEGPYRLICLFFWPGAAVFMLTPFFAVAGAVTMGRSWKERPELRWLVLLILVPMVLYTFRSAVTASFAPLARFTMKEVLLLLPFAGWGLAKQGPRLAWASVTIAAVWCVGLAVYAFEPNSRWSYTMRSISATSRLEPSVRVSTDWFQANAAPRGGLLIADEDPREFNDLIITYFSGFSFENQVRRRHDRYAELLGTREPRWLMLFDEGKMVRTQEVTAVDPEHVEFRGHRFELRHSARVKVFERVD